MKNNTRAIAVVVLLAFVAVAGAAKHDSIARHVRHSSLRSNKIMQEPSHANKTDAWKDHYPNKHGDLTCLRWTGGHCNMFNCHSDRGPTACEDGWCMCAKGSCATSEGVCEFTKGKWLGEHSIKFKNPVDQGSPYFATTAPSSWKADGSALAECQIDQIAMTPCAWLQSSADASPAWKVAMTPDNRLRFESISHPNYVLALEADSDPGGGGVGEVTDYRPVIARLSDVTALSATFQVRTTHKDGGGLEIWSPATERVVASGQPPGVVSPKLDVVATKEELPKYKGRQLVQFEPELPLKATPHEPRADDNHTLSPY